jgi:hypothetical protein
MRPAFGAYEFGTKYPGVSAEAVKQITHTNDLGNKVTRAAPAMMAESETRTHV